MPRPEEKLAESLRALQTLQAQGSVAIQSRNLSRTHRERLVRNGFLQEVMKGWYIPTNAQGEVGDSTPWCASFWSFVAAYLQERFGNDWCLSAEQSLTLHAGNWTVPTVLHVRAPRGANKMMPLPHGTSILGERGAHREGVPS